LPHHGGYAPQLKSRAAVALFVRLQLAADSALRVIVVSWSWAEPGGRPRLCFTGSRSIYWSQHPQRRSQTDRGPRAA